MPDRLHGVPVPKTDSTITGADWSDRELAGETHTRVHFVDLDLTEATSERAVFEECTFRRARFNVSSHTGSAFLNCIFVNCDFFDATFTDCKLVGSRFERCTYELLKVAGGNWSFVGMPGADLRSARLSGARFRDADFTGARFDGAPLRELELSGASLHRASFAECDLRGSEFTMLDPGQMNLRGAVITVEQALLLAAGLGLDVRVD